MGSIRILVSSDIHGVVLDHMYADGSIQPMGLSRLSTYIKQSRSNHRVIYIDNGDALQGTPLLTYINQQNEKPHKLGEVFNLLNTHFYNLGNHDFNYGKEVLFNFMESMSCPCITSNVLYHGNPLGKTQIINMEGITFGFIGTVTDYIPNWEKPKNIEGFEFLDVITTVQQEVNKIRNKADIIVVIYHGGIEKDLITHQPTERYTKENVGYQLAHLKGVDLCFTGHQHRSIMVQTTQALTLQCAHNMTELMQVDIDTTSKHMTGSLVSMKDLTSDQQIIDLVRHQEYQTQVWLDQPIGQLKEDCLITDQQKARIVKHPLVSFINQVQLDATDAQLSATSLFNDATGFNKIITMRDLVSTYVYPNTLVVKSMTGHQIMAMLEKCANYFIVDELGKIGINPEYQYPKAQHFNYDMIDGLTYTIKVSNPLGQRIIACSYQDEPFDLDRSYTIAMNNYRAVGGGDFEMVANAPTILDTNQDMVDIIARYIQKHTPVSIDHKDNILVIV